MLNVECRPRSHEKDMTCHHNPSGSLKRVRLLLQTRWWGHMILSSEGLSVFSRGCEELAKRKDGLRSSCTILFLCR
jgi:hypothetical protein